MAALWRDLLVLAEAPTSDTRVPRGRLAVLYFPEIDFAIARIGEQAGWMFSRTFVHPFFTARTQRHAHAHAQHAQVAALWRVLLVYAEAPTSDTRVIINHGDVIEMRLRWRTEREREREM